MLFSADGSESFDVIHQGTGVGWKARKDSYSFTKQ
ncbi:hypothetical protein N879_04690 [Alcaligenes sp. EGD-AK7]|nr:hypothetical protein N879_04690 [Alcaligenes sp. EGD-AK7]